MEIKVLCDCGQKYAFDAVPVQGRMPFTVTCPACGADGTPQANDIIRQSGVQTAPVGVLLTEIAPSPPAPPALAPAPGGLRINRPVPTENPPPAAALPPPPRPLPQHASLSAKPQKSKSQLTTVLTLVFIFAVIGFGVWKFGRKVYRGITSVVQVANAISEAKDAANANWNFQQYDAVVLYIQHTNHITVADACKDYWRDKLKKNLKAVPVTDDAGIGSHEYGVFESYNGWVRIMSSLEWRPEEFEGLSKHLSQQFGALIFETSDVDFSGAYHFGVYEAGTRKFHAKMEVKIKKDDFDEIVTTESDDWAIAHGFKPGPEGFKEFSLADGDQISQSMGMKIWDEPEERKAKLILLKEATD